MYCPQCGVEYRKGFTECADCQVALVTEKPAEPPHLPIHFVTVWETRDPGLLSLAKSVLQNAHVPFFAKNEGARDLLWVGPVELQVAEKHATLARDLLEKMEPEDLDEDLDEEE